MADGSVGGSEAAGLVLSTRSRGGRGHIGELSVAALRYGQELVDLPTGELALRLYSYGRRPVSPTLASRLADGVAFDTFLGLQPGGALERSLAAGWVRHLQREVGAGTGAAGARSGQGRWRNEPIPGTSSTSARRSTRSACDRGCCGLAHLGTRREGVQAGRRCRMLCRPDKLVVYFDRLDDLQDGAVSLERRLGVCPAHGIPCRGRDRGRRQSLVGSRPAGVRCGTPVG